MGLPGRRKTWGCREEGRLGAAGRKEDLGLGTGRRKTWGCLEGGRLGAAGKEEDLRLPGRKEDLGLPGSGGRLGAEEYDAFSLIVTVDSNSPPDTSHANSSFL